MIGIAGILLSLVLLMWLAYRGVSVIILAPVLAMFACLLNGGVPLLGTYTQVFMTAMGGFAVKYFPIFLLGALFGKLMEDSGCARSIARTFVHHIEFDAVRQHHALLLQRHAQLSAFILSIYPAATMPATWSSS